MSRRWGSGMEVGQMGGPEFSGGAFFPSHMTNNGSVTVVWDAHKQQRYFCWYSLLFSCRNRTAGNVTDVADRPDLCVFQRRRAYRDIFRWGSLRVGKPHLHTCCSSRLWFWLNSHHFDSTAGPASHLLLRLCAVSHDELLVYSSIFANCSYCQQLLALIPNKLNIILF